MATATLFDDLYKLNGLKPRGRLVIALLDGNQFISGSPYPTTCFAESAFRFPSQASARRIASRHFPKRKLSLHKVDD